MARIVVVGGGFAGMAAACRLSGDGHSVTLLEASLQSFPPAKSAWPTG